MKEKETRFNSYGEELTMGQVVYLRERITEKLEPSLLVLKSASKNYTCSKCKEIIYKGDIHASDFYFHACLDCITKYNDCKNLNNILTP